jgi:hypothetical protein
MALSNELRDALAKRRQARNRSALVDARKGVVGHDIPDHDPIAHQYYDQNTDGEPGPDTENPVSEDPNDSPDPDDRAALHTQQSNDEGTSGDAITLLPPLPEMPCSWWVRVVLGKPDDLVSDEDARMCLLLVSAHLRQAGHEAQQASPDARQARLGVREGEDPRARGFGRSVAWL